MMFLFGYAEKGIPFVRKMFVEENHVAVASFGGGPGFSAIGFYGYLLFDVQFRNKNVTWYIFDYEAKWVEQVELVKSTFDRFMKYIDLEDGSILPAITIEFATCDVKASIHESH